MATVITSECINCGACEPECPNTAIYQGGVEWQAPDGSMHAAISNDIFYIVPEKCTECVGFYDQEACAKVCPVDCCVPDPALPESEAVLLERARALHPDKTIPDDAPSRSSTSGVGGSWSSSRSGSGWSWSSSPPSCAPSPCARRRLARPPSVRAFSASEAAPPRVPDRPPGGRHAGGAARPGLHRAGPRSGVRRALPRHAARRRPALPLRGRTLAGARP